MEMMGFEPAPAVAVVGAGMSGLALARRLTAAGMACTLFDKSRGVGGRMSTRRAGSLEFDHGAQFFTARGPLFSELINEWRSAGLTAEWFDNALVGTPRMTSPTQAMAAPHTLVTRCHVTGLSRTPTGWSIQAAAGAVPTPANNRFIAVALAMPAPQAAVLAASAGAAFPDLDHVVYAPCWTLMLAFSAPIDLPAEGLRPADGPVAWIARNAGKPGRSAEETLVLQATPEWSRANLERPPEDVAADLLTAFVAATGVWTAPDFASVHRWRYALVEATAGRPCLWDADLAIGACGDWALGPRLECAFDSGEALARHIIENVETARADAA